MTAFVLLLALLVGAQAAYRKCDYFQRFKLEDKFEIASPGYPRNYTPDASCRWFAVSPPNTTLSLVCSEFELPFAQNCALDGLGVSRKGRRDLDDIVYYCGNGQIDVMSSKNRLNVVLRATDASPGGKFKCLVRVHEVVFGNVRPLGVKHSSDSHPYRDSDMDSGDNFDYDYDLDHGMNDYSEGEGCKCGHTNRVNDTWVAKHEFPMLAGVVYIERKYKGVKILCSATIISNRHALTSAHCVYRIPVDKTQLLVGDHDVSKANETDMTYVHVLDKFIIHPDYDNNIFTNDIAILRTFNSIKFNKFVGPACLPFKEVNKNFEGEFVYYLGWGPSEFGGQNSMTPNHLHLTVVSQKMCKATYGSLLTEKQMCTFRYYKQSCQSDKGGTLLWMDPKTRLYKVVGLVSYGILCGGFNPNVNTKVTPYLNWIKQVTGKSFCVA